MPQPRKHSIAAIDGATRFAQLDASTVILVGRRTAVDRFGVLIVRNVAG